MKNDLNNIISADEAAEIAADKYLEGVKSGKFKSIGQLIEEAVEEKAKENLELEKALP